MQGGTIVDASIIEASSSTKNRTGQRDPEMHQVKKGNQYYFGMKLHIGVDAVTGMVHSFSDLTPKLVSLASRVRLLLQRTPSAFCLSASCGA